MIEAVFISDLHLHPEEAAIKARFDHFLAWAATHTKAVYILGDFFHAWPGDDALDEWSNSIALQLLELSSRGVAVYMMHGNRDFLLGERFFRRASVTFLPEPSMITLGSTPVLLVHGDRYCTEDKGHQWLRRLTRNRLFPWLFLRLPYSFRSRLVSELRAHSAAARHKPRTYFSIVTDVLLRHLQFFQTKTVIHGHIHQPGLLTHQQKGDVYQQYVLSDWDDNPQLLCYDNSKGFYFDLISMGE